MASQRMRACSRIAMLLVAALAVPAMARGEAGVIQTAGARLAREAGRQQGVGAPRVEGRPVTSPPSRDAQGTGLSRSGMGRGKKIAIGLGLAVAFAAGVWAIDQGVEDNTPSSRGLR